MSYIHPLSAYVFLKLKPTDKSVLEMIEMIEILEKHDLKVMGTNICL